MTLLNEAKTYYFQFSTGSYSDYSVNGLFICDHAIEESEWDEHYRNYCASLEEKRQDSKRTWALHKHPEAVNESHSNHWCVDWSAWYVSEEYNVWQNWKEQNNPEKTFQEKHGMIPVECTEMWRD